MGVLRVRALSLAVALVGLLAWEHARAQPGPGGKTKPREEELLERFDQLTSKARLELVEKLPQADKAFQAAERGDVALTIVARGALESANNTDIICKVRTFRASNATVIRWVIDDGTQVKKGDLLMQMDDADLQALLKDKKKDAARARADRAAAAEHLESVQKDNEARVRLGEIDVRLAELESKKYTGKDADEKEALKLKVERARLRLERARATAQTRVAQAKADLASKESVAEIAAARLPEIEESIKACRIVAPKDGFVTYYVPEQVRNAAQHPLVAQGEPVREGQKLLQIPDLSKMRVSVRVAEGLVAFVHSARPGDKDKWQRARTRVDAFANRVLAGHVQLVDTAPSQQDWFAPDVKVYKVQIHLDEVPPGLKPGMSAEVTIDVERRTDVLRVPAQAVVRDGKAQFCYVKSAGELQKRAVKLGLGNDTVVEVRSGLKAGEAVLRDPPDVARRLSRDLTAPVKGGEKQ